MTSDGGLKPVPLQGQAPSYPASIVRRALELVSEHRVIYRAHNILKAEMGAWGFKAPVWSAMYMWAKENEDVIARIDAHGKRDMDRIAGEVALASAEKMLTAIEDDGKVAHSQRAMDYGISMDKVIGLAKVGQAGPTTAIQINVTSGGKKLED